MRKKIANGLLVACLLVTGFSFICSGEIHAAPFGFVDTRLLLLCHPVFQALDLETRRFVGTSSEASGDLQGEKARLTQEIQRLEQGLAGARTELQKAYSQVRTPAERQGAETRFWSGKKDLEASLKQARERLELLTRLPQLPSDTGGAANTPHESIAPQIAEIERDIRETIAAVQIAQGVAGIMDLAPLSPEAGERSPDPTLLYANWHWVLSRGELKPQQYASFQQWLREARLHWRQTLPSAQLIPFRHGCQDLRALAVETLRQRRPTR